MIGHGFYPRKALGLTPVYGLSLKRWCCAACHHTVALLPSFLLPYRHYLLAVIQVVAITCFEDVATWVQVAQRCSVNEAPSPRTIGRWCDAFAEHAATWWAAVQRTLAEHDAGSPVLDPLGEAAGPRAAPRALVHIAVHLLAWATHRPTAATRRTWADPLDRTSCLRPDRSAPFPLALGGQPRLGPLDLAHRLCGWCPASKGRMLSAPIKIIPGVSRMSPRPPSETDPVDRNTAIALFRYGLIAQLVHTPPEVGQQEQLLREIAARPYTIPGSTRTRVSITTLRRYLKTYEAQGFDALRPTTRMLACEGPHNSAHCP